MLICGIMYAQDKVESAPYIFGFTFVGGVKMKLKLWYYKLRTLFDWQMTYKSARTIPTMKRRFKRWQKWNPPVSELLFAAIKQMDAVEFLRKEFDKHIKKNPAYGQLYRIQFNNIENQIRLIFSDLTDLMIGAGAPYGRVKYRKYIYEEAGKDLRLSKKKLATLRSLVERSA